jgi:hypothetical protein
VNARAGGGGARRAVPWKAGVRFSPAATAAAAALLLVTWSMVTFPAVPLASRWDAVTNEWIIWFTAFYLPLFAAATSLRRLRRPKTPQSPPRPTRPSPTRGEGPWGGAPVSSISPP